MRHLSIVDDQSDRTTTDLNRHGAFPTHPSFADREIGPTSGTREIPANAVPSAGQGETPDIVETDEGWAW
ncbi:hypothetical protein [Haloferula rosea]|uniref:Uncharacterized protein n=1 Tax=Haloferula rosea TaxID=490093 RepID=A0A934V9V6_9BACT|nr:hypothetical protein [Haloferula rosea]MBK1825648.1 hypothetical protein [Haloferula rosea]